MQYLIYMSTASKLMNDAELADILKQSQHNNAINKLTGILLYSEGTFVQVLEGPEEQLQNSYDKIKGDIRHRGIIKLAQATITERIFPHWTMGFNTLSKKQFAELSAYLHPSEHAQLNGEASHPAITILKTFAENNHLL